MKMNWRIKLPSSCSTSTPQEVTNAIPDHRERNKDNEPLFGDLWYNKTRPTGAITSRILRDMWKQRPGERRF